MKQLLRAISKALHKGRHPEMVDLKAYDEPQMDETAVQQTLPATTVENKSDATPERIRARDEAIWLEERPKVIEAIKSGVAVLRKTSTQMRTNRAVRDAEKTDTNNS